MGLPDEQCLAIVCIPVVSGRWSVDRSSVALRGVTGANARDCRNSVGCVAPSSDSNREIWVSSAALLSSHGEFLAHGPCLHVCFLSRQCVHHKVCLDRAANMDQESLSAHNHRNLWWGGAEPPEIILLGRRTGSHTMKCLPKSLFGSMLLRCVGCRGDGRRSRLPTNPPNTSST